MFNKGVIGEGNWINEVQRDQLRLLAYLCKSSLRRTQLLNEGFTPQRISSLKCLVPAVIVEDKKNQLFITDFGRQYFQANKYKM